MDSGGTTKKIGVKATETGGLTFRRNGVERV
jgi:hypothetical protein